MKAIAEYFRDLASDDRYFGAEPPTPDAEMLARIAEREVKHRVEARIDDNQVVLRARIADDSSPADVVEITVPATPAAPYVEAAPAPVAPVIPAAPVVAEFEEDQDTAAPGFASGVAQPGFSPVFVDRADEGTKAGIDESSVAAKLSRIRAVVARNAGALPAVGDSVEGPAAEEVFAGTLAEDDESAATPETVTEDSNAGAMGDNAATFAGAGQPAQVPEHFAVASEEETTEQQDPIEHIRETGVEADFAKDIDGEELNGTQADDDTDYGAIAGSSAGGAFADTLSEDDITSILNKVAVDTGVSDEDVAFDTAGYEAYESDTSLKSLVTEINGGFEPVAKDFDENADEYAADPDDAGDENITDADATRDAVERDIPAAADTQGASEPDEDTAAPDQSAENLFVDETAEEEPLVLTTAGSDGFSDDAPVEDSGYDSAPETDAVSGFDEAGSDDPEETLADQPVEDAPESTGVETAATEEEETPRQTALQRARARVVKVRKSELDDAIASGELPDVVVSQADQDSYEDESADMGPDLHSEMVAEHPGSLTEERETELQDALAQLDTEAGFITETPDEDEAIEDETIEESGPVTAGRDILASESAEDEDSVNRLLEVTNTRLDSPENSRRRSAISHLRAAVAATVADRRITRNRSDDDSDNTDAYRADLASVVKPAPGQDDAEKTRATQGARPAPLVLVSEQRIDTPAEAAPVPETAPAAAALRTILPRRVHRASSAAVDIRSEFEDELEVKATVAGPASFAEFAETAGASDLPDLIEASAAYVTYVNNQPHFTRPQIMRNVADYAGRDNFNREDALRSFGQLLRDQRIVKLRRGQFAVAEETRFRPENAKG